MNKPELVLPAGNLEKLKIAYLFGADAVYLGGENFSLRSGADNFTPEEIKTAINVAAEEGKKAYIALNILAHNRDLEPLIPYIEMLGDYKPHGFIISDPGVLMMARKYAPLIPITVSTQANVTNYAAARFYQDLGVKRIVLARELSLDEIAQIKEHVAVELEVFIHGAMCVSYSGRCLLSQYMTGRSANLGLCAHPCRYSYTLMEEKRPGEYYSLEEDARGTYILNSRDLCLLAYLPRLVEIGVDAFKIEGRMKSPLYVAVTAQTYRQAIDVTFEIREELWEYNLEYWQQQLKKVATRPFTTGFITGEAGIMQDDNKEPSRERTEFCGLVRGYDANMIVIEQRANFGCGDKIELLLPDGTIIAKIITELYDEQGLSIDRARHPQQTVKLPAEAPVPLYTIVRKVGNEKN